MAANLTPHQLRALIQDFYLQNDQEKIYNGMDFNGLVKWTQANGLHKLNEMLQLQYGKQIEVQQLQSSVPIAMGQTNPNAARDRFKRLSRAVSVGSTQLQLEQSRNKAIEKEIRQKLNMFYTVVDESKLSAANARNFEKAIQYALHQGIDALDGMLRDTYGKTLDEGCEEFNRGRKVVGGGANLDDHNLDQISVQLDTVQLTEQLTRFLQKHGDFDNLETVPDMCGLVEEKGKAPLNRYLFENYGQSLDDFLQEEQELDDEYTDDDQITESEEELVSLRTEDLENGNPFENMTDSELLAELGEFYRVHDAEHYESTQHPEKRQQLIRLARAKGRVELNRIYYSLYQAIITPLDHPRPPGLDLTLARPPKSPTAAPPMPVSPRPNERLQSKPNIHPSSIGLPPRDWSESSRSEDDEASLPPPTPKRTGRPLPPLDGPGYPKKDVYRADFSSMDKGSYGGDGSLPPRKPNDAAYGRMNQEKIHAAQHNIERTNGARPNQPNPYDFTLHTQETVAGSIAHQSDPQYPQFEVEASASQRVIPHQPVIAPVMSMPPLQPPKKKQGFGARIMTMFRGKKKKQSTLAAPVSMQQNNYEHGQMGGGLPMSPNMGRPSSPTRSLPPIGIPQQNGVLSPYRPLPGQQQANYEPRRQNPTIPAFDGSRPQPQQPNARPTLPEPLPRYVSTPDFDTAKPQPSPALSMPRRSLPQPHPYETSYSTPMPQVPPKTPRVEPPPSLPPRDQPQDIPFPVVPPRTPRFDSSATRKLMQPVPNFSSPQTGRAVPPVSTFRPQKPETPQAPAWTTHIPPSQSSRDAEPCDSYVFDIMSGDCQNCRWPKHEHLKQENRRNDRQNHGEGVNGIIDKFDQGKKKKRRRRKKRQPKKVEDDMFLLLASKEAQAKFAASSLNI
eukprot:snap_masked-scaffold_1-processed-gene-20.45-mRNA-1 protein AED:1.00 eAED:1.00 QI:0/-1/0/0/-1/1/1/0/898